MEQITLRYIMVAAILEVIVIGAELIISNDWVDALLVAVIMTCGYSCVVMGLYCYLEGKGSDSVNGVDWSSMSDTEKRNFIAFMGLFYIVGAVVLMIGVAVLMGMMVAGIILILVSVGFLLIPLLMKEKGKSITFKEKSNAKKIAVFAVVSVLAIVPTVYLVNNEYNTEAILVDFGDTNLHIKAPMVDLTIPYSEIHDIGLDPDFDKGSRIYGYGTPTICSNHFRNAVFGDYTLASYTKVQPCVFFLYNGNYYAFNQNSDELTQAAYDTLAEKIRG